MYQQLLSVQSAGTILVVLCSVNVLNSWTIINNWGSIKNSSATDGEGMHGYVENVYVVM